jgi:hypothetical protein
MTGDCLLDEHLAIQATLRFLNKRECSSLYQGFLEQVQCLLLEMTVAFEVFEVSKEVHADLA